MRARTIVLLVAMATPVAAQGQTESHGPNAAARPVVVRVPLIIKYVLDEAQTRVEGRPVYIIRSNGPAQTRGTYEERTGVGPGTRIEVVTITPP